MKFRRGDPKIRPKFALRISFCARSNIRGDIPSLRYRPLCTAEKKETLMPTTRYIWDVASDNLLMERDGSGGTIAKYTHEPGSYDNLISQNRNGQEYSHHFDGEGNTRAVTDQDSVAIETAAYSAFGEIVDSTGVIVNPFGYRGALGFYANPETADLALPNIVYSPAIGRWLSATPAVHGSPAGYAHQPNTTAARAPKFPPGDMPGTFIVAISECSPEYKKQGCCCSAITVTYKPSNADKLAYSRICVEVFAWTRITRAKCTDVDDSWHPDPPKDKQSCWSSPPIAGDSGISASWTDFPGGGPKEGPHIRFDRLCPWICAWTKLQQNWWACAVGYNKAKKPTRIGCVKYGHVCDLTFTRIAEAGAIGVCCIVKCKMTRAGSGQDIQPSPLPEEVL